MPEYEYRAKDGPEKLVQGILQASSETAAIEKITGLGLVPIAVNLRESHQKAEAASVLFQSKRRSKSQVIFFSRHLSSLLKSGVPILKALAILAEQEKGIVFRKVLDAILLQIKQGSSLSGAMKQWPDYFPPMVIAILSAGEASGALPESLLRIVGYLKKEEELRSKISRAMAYPTFLAAAGLGTVLFILTFVVPKLTRIFLSLGRKLPLPTRLIIGLGDFMNHGWIYLAILGLAGVLIFRWAKSKRSAQGCLNHLALRLPYVGNLVLKAELARFARTVEISLSNGIPFLDALRLAIPTLDNLILREAVEEAYQRVQKGDSFGQSLRPCGFFPHFVTDLILIGEESGHLEEVLLEIAETYEQETDDEMMMLTTLLEPSMILIVGGVVGFIVIAMLLPIFEMNAVF